MSDSTRRTFMAGSALAGSAAASALMARDARAAVGDAPTAKLLRIGVVGVGEYSHLHSIWSPTINAERPDIWPMETSRMRITHCWDSQPGVAEKYADTNIESVMGDGMMAGLCCEFQHKEDGHVVWMSEDYAFCERWHQMGGKIFADTSIALLHHGYYGFSIPGWPRGVKQL